jgi:hypothetical protein
MESISGSMLFARPACNWMLEIDRILDSEDVVGALTRDVPVWILNISASGCLLESGFRVEVGTTGVLSMTRDGQDYTDDIRINRCSPVAGGSGRYLLGAQFLWTRIPGERSLRLVTRRLKLQDDRRQQFRLTGLEAP